MSLYEQGFDSLSILTGAQLSIPHTMGNIDGGVGVGMGAMPTDLTAKRLLIGSILLVDI